MRSGDADRPLPHPYKILCSSQIPPQVIDERCSSGIGWTYFRAPIWGTSDGTFPSPLSRNLQRSFFRVSLCPRLDGAKASPGDLLRGGRHSTGASMSIAAASPETKPRNCPFWIGALPFIYLVADA